MFRPRPMRALALGYLVSSVLAGAGCGSDDPTRPPEDPPAEEFCADYGALGSGTFRYEANGFIGGSARSGDYILAASATGLRSLRVSDSGELTDSDVIDMYSIAVRAHGDHAYVLAETELLVVDVSDPSAMTAGNSVALGENLRRLEVGDGHAVVSDVAGRLYVLSLADPVRPIHIATLDMTRTRIYDLALARDVVFVATDVGLRVVSIASLAEPVEIGQFQGNRIYSVASSGSLVAVFGPADGVKVIDVVDPTRPTEAGDWDLYSPAEGIVGISSDRVYLETRNGVFVLRHNDGQNVEELGFAPHEETAPNDLVLDGADLYLSGGSLQGMRFAEGVALPDPVAVTSEAFNHLVAEGNLVFGTGADRVLGYDLSDPGSPVLLFDVGLDETATALAYSEGSVWIGTATGLSELIVDIDPPTIGRTVDLGARVDALAAENGFAYVSRSTEFVVLDLAADDPEIVGAEGAVWPGDELQVRDGLAFLYREGWGFELFDVRVPSAPVSIRAQGFVPDPTALSASASGGFLAAGLIRELRIVDPAGQNGVPILSSTALPSDIRDLAIAGDLIYVSTTHRVEIIDVADGTRPQRVGTWPIRGGGTEGTRLLAFGDHLLLWTSRGLERLPAQCPER